MYEIVNKQNNRRIVKKKKHPKEKRILSYEVRNAQHDRLWSPWNSRAPLVPRHRAGETCNRISVAGAAEARSRDLNWSKINNKIDGGAFRAPQNKSGSVSVWAGELTIISS